MKRHTLLAFFVILFAFATSAKAQDCSNAYYSGASDTQTPPDPVCSGSSEDLAFTVLEVRVAYCDSTNTGTTYAESTRQVTGYGVWHCSNTTSLDQKCNPTIQPQVTHATSPTDYNRFYLRAWDANPAQYCGTFVNMSRQDTWQCRGVACSGVPGCTFCPKGVTLDCNSPCGSPILLDITGKGFHLTSAEEGVKFDISGSGHPMQMGWTAPGADNAFLALPGSNGLIDSGKELFGNFTPQPPSKTPNGFAALAVYDLPKNGGNGDGIIDKRDAIFSPLRLWIDLNHDGISQPDEIFTLPALGINSISLKYTGDNKTDEYGNQFRYRARLNPDKPDDAGKLLYDVFFVTLDSSKSASLCLIPPIAARGSRIH